MKKLLFIVALLSPAPGHAAWTAVGQFLSTSTKTGSDPFISTSTLALEIGNFANCGAVTDNDGDGTDTNDFSGVSDGAGNTWVQAGVGENEVDPGAANAGAAVSSAYTLATAELTAGGTIAFNLGTTKNSKAANCWEFTVYAGATITVMGAEQKEDAGGSTDVGALTISDLSSTEHLCIRWVASETGTTEAYAETAGWTPMGDTGTTGGTDNTNQRVWGEYIIATATSFTSDPTITGGTFDRASTMICFDETGGTPPAGGSRRIISIQ